MVGREGGSPEWLSPADYAKHRGCSRAAVSQALKDGRIKAESDPKTGRLVIDVAQADHDWAQKTRHDKRVNGLGKPPPAELAPAPVPNPAPAPRIEAEASEAAIAEAEALFASDEIDLEVLEAQLPKIAVSRAVREAYGAKLAKLDYDQKAGKLIEAAIVGSEWEKVAAVTRTKVLGIPTKTRQAYPDMDPELYEALERICREALEDLANERA